jgi:LmbE family N-acetylglucosaminyl deacetylase/tetratricopeptide (TPR) repeat protein
MIPLLLSILLLQATYLDLYQDGKAYLEAGKIREAESALVQSASLNPEHEPTIKTLAKLYVNRKQFHEAIGFYRRLVQLNTYDINAREHLAELYSWTGNHDKAIVAYKDALALDPQNVSLKTGLAKVYRWTNRYHDAEDLYNDVLQAEPDHHEALKGISKTYAMMGNFHDSLQVLKKAIELYPEDAELYKENGVVLAWRKNFRKAVRMLEKAVELSPNYVDAYRTMGDVYFWMDDHHESAKQYKRAMEIEPDNVKGRIMLAKAYASMGKNRLAEEHLGIALGINPLDEEAMALLNSIKGDRFLPFNATVGEIIEVVSYLFVLGIVFLAYWRNRKLLRRRNMRYSVFINAIMPLMAVLAVGMYVGRNWFNARLWHGFSESILFFAMGLSFISLLHSYYKTKEFKGKVFLAIGAHPDDIELGCSGFLMKAREGSAKVYGLTLTKGERGINGKGRRELEQTKAAQSMGYDGFWILDFPDTQVRDHLDEVKNIIEQKIKEIDANVVLTHTPIDIHSDHQAVFEATKEAARNVREFLSYEDVSTPNEFVPNFYVDISDYIKDKIRLIAFHRTQEHKFYMDPEAIKGRAAHRGLQSGVYFAEAFKAHKILQ